MKTITLTVALVAALTQAVSAQNLRWTETVERTLGSTRITVERGSLTVPENRANPRARTLVVPVERWRATGGAPSESPPLFLLDGGPGQPNIGGGPLPPRMVQTRAVVFVGYRGVEGSLVLPGRDLTQALFQFDEQDPQGLARVAGVYRDFVTRARAEGFDLDGYTIDEVVSDLEAVRTALGYGAVDLYGMSYGTRVAYEYASSHPSSVRKMILLGANPPGHFLVESRDVDTVLERYAALWAANPRRADRARTLVADVKEVLARPHHDFLWWRVSGGTVRLGFSLFLGQPDTAAILLDALVRAKDGDNSGLAGLALFSLLAQGSMNAGDLYLKGFEDLPGVTSTAGTTPFTLATFGAAQTLDPSWLPNHARRPPRSPQVVGQPTLVIGGVLDSMTPLRGVEQDMMPLLSQGSLVRLETNGHTDWPKTQADEAGVVMERFLDQGTVPSEVSSSPVPLEPPFSAGVIAWSATVLVLLAGGLLGVLVLFVRKRVIARSAGGTK